MEKEVSKMKLLKYKKIIGKIVCETGLHIGGASEKIEIGGMDNPVIRNPIDDFPYIPGSSIKGKMRTLLEWDLGKVIDDKVHTCNDMDCPICRIFGTSAEEESKSGPTRLIVRDANLVGLKDCPEEVQKKDENKEKCPYIQVRQVSKSSAEKCKTTPCCSVGILQQLKREKGLPYAEEKWENTINRITATANPRQMERVPAGIEFEFEMVYRVFDKNNNENKTDEQLFEYVKRGLELLQQDCLGGSGSRGYGKIKVLFKNGNNYQEDFHAEDIQVQNEKNK